MDGVPGGAQAVGEPVDARAQAERGVEEDDLAHVGCRAYDARRMDGLLERDRELAALDRLIADAEEGAAGWR